jgi:hypothetical protein
MRTMYAQMKLLSEKHYGVLREFYTERHHSPSETEVAAAHKGFYALRGIK